MNPKLNLIFWTLDQKDWPITCFGKNQSPINIETKSVIINKSLSVKWFNYDVSYDNFNIENNGHTGHYQNEI